ncbi:helix-turn-helix domain-containing protein [Nonomuraea roseoviolacea subsp. roseoviolacea]|uniref:winged helix-turn-helix transcriptional regulator n=1 Tax=Nonomuraea roseoviolacea TaxID=103837 RepID=UPI0031D5F807
MDALAQPAVEAERTLPALEFDVFARACPSRATFEHITGRWGSLVLIGLNEHPMRFNELRRRVDGVSDKMLTQTLQALERDGFVHRSAREGFPSRVDYSLTPLGERTAVKLWALIELLEADMPEVLKAQAAYDERRSG